MCPPSLGPPPASASSAPPAPASPAAASPEQQTEGTAVPSLPGRTHSERRDHVQNVHCLFDLFTSASISASHTNTDSVMYPDVPG